MIAKVKRLNILIMWFRFSILICLIVSFSACNSKTKILEDNAVYNFKTNSLTINKVYDNKLSVTLNIAHERCVTPEYSGVLIFVDSLFVGKLKSEFEEVINLGIQFTTDEAIVASKDITTLGMYCEVNGVYQRRNDLNDDTDSGGMN